MRVKLGDYIVFKAATRASYRKARRKVTGFYFGKPTVGYAGWSDFVVQAHEIISVEKA